jgi:ubiquitin-protein ligase
MSAKRLETERIDLEKEKHIVIKKSDNVWEINIAGPPGTAFEGGQFTLEFILDNFPFKAPVVSFKTQIYHPNVSDKGEVCKDMIETGDKWAPTKRLTKVIEKIINMMHTPNPDTALNGDAAKDFRNGTWEKKAAEDTKKFAKPQK